MCVGGWVWGWGQVCALKDAKEEREAEAKCEGPSHRQRAMGCIFHVSF